jgi:hypothetical protein
VYFHHSDSPIAPVIAVAFVGIAVEQVEPNLQRLIEIRARLPEYLFTQTT